jgi:outer membrane usher protein
LVKHGFEISLMLGLLLSTGSTHANDSPATSPTPNKLTATEQTKADKTLPMAVTVNGAKSGTWLFIERAGALYVQRDALEEWRIILDADTKPIVFRGQKFWPLDAVPGYKEKINFANQSVDLLFSPKSFTAIRLANEVSKQLVISPTLPSVFFNYDLSYSTSY